MSDAVAVETPPEKAPKRERGKLRYYVWAFLALIIVWTLVVAIWGHRSPAEDAAGEKLFQPQNEFALPAWVNLDLGFIDLSINKAVAYLMASSLICILVGLFVVRGGLRMRPTGAQNVLELIYDFADKQIARTTLGASKMLTRYFPFVATMFLFILVNNLISFVPLPGGEHKSLWGVPDLALYAATGNINVTVALAFVTFVVFNYEGIAHHGFGGYLKSYIPSGDIHPIMKGFVFILEMLSTVLRLVSLSVRLFANMLAGHLLIIMASGFVLLLGNYFGAVAIPFGLFFYLFEMLLVAGLQAFIFAMLSGIYIGFATADSH